MSFNFVVTLKDTLSFSVVVMPSRFEVNGERRVCDEQVNAFLRHLRHQLNAIALFYDVHPAFHFKFTLFSGKCQAFFAETFSLWCGTTFFPYHRELNRSAFFTEAIGPFRSVTSYRL